MKQTLAEYIRQGRKAKSMTQVELESATGIAQTYISELERGNRRPSEDICKQLAGALGLDYKRLIELRSALPASPNRNTNSEMRLLRAIRAGDRREAEVMLNAMLPA